MKGEEWIKFAVFWGVDKTLVFAKVLENLPCFYCMLYVVMFLTILNDMRYAWKCVYALWYGVYDDG